MEYIYKGIKIGIWSHPINDGNNYNGCADWYLNIKITHVEMVNNSADLTKELLLDLLKGT